MDLPAPTITNAIATIINAWLQAPAEQSHIVRAIVATTLSMGKYVMMHQSTTASLDLLLPDCALTQMNYVAQHATTQPPARVTEEPPFAASKVMGASAGV